MLQAHSTTNDGFETPAVHVRKILNKKEHAKKYATIRIGLSQCTW